MVPNIQSVVGSLLGAIALIVIVTVIVTQFVLEFTHDPVISDEEWETEMCIRPLPHVCKDNGPCNGWPKDGIL